MVEAMTETGSRCVMATVASGKVRIRRTELLQMLGRLEDPAVGAALPLQGLEHLLEILVVGRLVVGEVVVAPARHGGDPLEKIRGEVERLQLDLLVDVLGSHVVHGPQQGQQRILTLEALATAREPRMLAVGSGRLARNGDGLEALPVGQGAQARVGGDQVEQVGGARAREARDDDGPRDLDVQDLRVASDHDLRVAAGWQRSERNRPTPPCVPRVPKWDPPPRSSARCAVARGSRPHRSRRAPSAPWRPSARRLP